jgi:hypothetical protein
VRVRLGSVVAVLFGLVSPPQLASWTSASAPTLLAHSGSVASTTYPVRGSSHHSPPLGARPTAAPGAPCTNYGSISYCGGPVQHHPRVFVLFWGSAWCGSTPPPPGATSCPLPHDKHPKSAQLIEQQVLRLFGSLGHSGYNNLLTEYFDLAGVGATYVSNDTVLGGEYIYLPSPSGVGEGGAVGALDAVQASQGWQPGLDTQFAVFPQDSYAGAAPCPNHASPATNDSQSVIDWDPTSPTICGSAYSSLKPADRATYAASHEYAEAATDPEVTPAFASPTAWATEIGDLCGTASPPWGNGGGLGPILVARLWDRLSSTCVLSLAPQTNGPGPVSATPGANSATVSWHAVTPSASLPLWGYEVSAILNGRRSVSTATIATSITLTGLVRGSRYQFTVTPLVAGGFGLPATSKAITPTGTGATYASRVLADGPIAYYRLDDTEGPVVTDSSKCGHDAIGGAEHVAGALRGDPDYAETGGGTGPLFEIPMWTTSGVCTYPTGAHDVTVEAWMNDTLSGTQQIFFWGETSTPGNSITGSLSPNSVTIESSGTVVFPLPSGVSSNDGAWHQIVVTITAAGEAAVYFDGTPLGVRPLGTFQPNVSSEYALFDATGPGGGDAAIDEVAVYPRALTPSSVTAHYRAAGYVPAPLYFVPSGIDFAAISVGTVSQPTVVNLFNATANTTTVSGIAINGSDSSNFAVTANGCTGSQLAPGASCQLSVDFKPLISGNLSATLTAQDSAGDISGATLEGTSSGSGWAQWQSDGASSGFNAGENHLSPSNIATVSEAWSGTTSGFSFYAEPAVADGIVYAGATNGNLYAFAENCGTNEATCVPLWTAATGGNPAFSTPAISNGLVYVAPQGGPLDAFPAVCSGTCSPVWTGALANTSDTYNIPTVADGTVYVITGCCSDSTLYAFSATCGVGGATCTPVWTADIPGGSGGVRPTVADGEVYVGSNAGLLAFPVSCNAAPCTPSWVGGSGSFGTPAVYAGQVYAVAGGSALYAFPTQCGSGGATCSPDWSAQPPTGSGLGVPALANGVAYIPSGFDSVLNAFSTTCGSATVSCAPLWTAPISSPNGGGFIYGESSPAVANGLVYAHSFDTAFAFPTSCATSGPSCQPLWVKTISETGGGSGVLGGPVVADGMLFATGAEGLIAGFSAT